MGMAEGDSMADGRIWPRSPWRRGSLQASGASAQPAPAGARNIGIILASRDGGCPKVRRGSHGRLKAPQAACNGRLAVIATCGRATEFCLP